MADFYVYEHRRADTGAVFYVGKGKGARLHSRQHKTAYWRNVVAKAGGYQAAVVVGNLDEELALLAEVELIDKRRRVGARLVNLTDGGDGMSGYRWPSDAVAARAEKQRGQKRPSVSARLRGIPKSAEHRAKLSEAKKGRRASDETRARMSETRRLMPMPRVTCPHCLKAMTKLNAGRWHFDKCKEKN